ncbi:MAG: helix-turn-helix domain-containing protein [Rhodothalassiaceae bacterium]
MLQSQPASYDHIAEWYEGGPYMESLQRSRRFALESGLDVGLIRMRHSPGPVKHAPLSSYTIFTLTRGQPGATVDLGAGMFHVQAKPGMLAVMPPDVSGFFDNDSSHEAVAISVPGTVFDRILSADERFQAGGVAPLLDRLVDDPMSSGLLVSLWQDAGFTNRLDRLYVDSALHLIAARLLNQVYPVARRDADLDVGNARVRQALDYINDHLDSSLTLEEIARVAHCSSFHLARLFKRHLNTTVHGYVMEQRLGLAQRLLVDPEISIADIARRCGFSSQSHLTAAFRRQIGLTPAVFRREALR